MSKVPPYIGVTGFMSSAEVQEVLKEVPDSFLRDTPLREFAFVNRKLMVGVLVSDKTLRGEKTRRWRRYPKINKVKDIFCADSRCLNYIHFASDTSAELYDKLVKLVEIGGENLDGFQLNIEWPDVNELKKFREDYPYYHIVMQCKKSMMEGKNWFERWLQPYLFAIKLAPYVQDNLMDYILLDISGGEGKDLNVNQCSKFIKHVERKYPSRQFLIGLAGGLNHTNAAKIYPILRNVDPKICCDAEGGLRDENDALIVESTKSYVVNCFDMCLKAIEKFEENYKR